NFGLSYIDAGVGGGASLKTAYFTLQASSNLTQVLFFKFSSSDATMKSGQCQMSLRPQMMATSGDALQHKEGPFVIDNIKNINILTLSLALTFERMKVGFAARRVRACL